MRCKTIIPLLALPLLGGCLEPEYLTTRPPSEPSALEETTSLRDAGLHYTSHLAPPFDPKSFPSW